ncbi:MAG: dipeptidase [Alphaproteobacteria bacterium]
MVNAAATALHRDSLVIDGLIFFSDGDVSALKAGGVDAVNLTVSNFITDFTTTCDEIAAWCAVLAAPGSPWHLVLSAEDIALARTAGRIGLIMGWQNMRPIEDKLERLALFHRLGVRVMQLTYNERNFIGDGCLEPHDAGLSRFGRRVIAEMNRLGLAIDLSHVGERTCLESAEVSTRPVLVTHANAKAVSDVPRNKSDAVIKAVAATGGTIGLSVYGPMCWDGRSRPRLGNFLRHLEHVVELVGVEHVAFGTDFPAVSDLSKLDRLIATTLERYPGAVSSYARAFGNDIRTRYLEDCGSPRDLGAITALLIGRGWAERDVRAFLGENLRRVLGAIWGG